MKKLVLAFVALSMVVILCYRKAIAATVVQWSMLSDVAPEFGFWKYETPDGVCYLYLDSQQSGLQCNWKQSLAADPTKAIFQLTQMCTTLNRATISAAGLSRVCTDVVGHSDGCDHDRH